jgi:transposase
VIRARIVLAAADGATNNEIAAEVGVHVDTVRKWRRRFVAAGLPGLDDLPRSGRPREFTPVQVAEVKALACTLPAETGQSLSRWSGADLATEAITRGLVETISPATVRRWLAADAIKPGSTGPGSTPATPTSRPRPPGCSTCMRGGGRATHWVPTTT